MNILMVEDDPITSTVLDRVFTQLGHTVTLASNGYDALECLTGDVVFNAVVSDLMMPEMNGLELCRRIRATHSQSPGQAYLYFILLTSSATDDVSRVALEAGADDCLAKSLDSTQLEARLSVAERITSLQHDLLRRSEKIVERQTELSSINASLSEQITVDGLTSLKNHRAFFEELERSFAFARRQNAPLSVLLVDVDNFKAYNDTHGHLAGDDVLRTVAQILRGSLRMHDFVARYGGEEFAIILPLTDTENALTLAERLRMLVQTHPWSGQMVTASFGVAGCTPATKTPAALVQSADRALYHCKHNGRNRSSLLPEDSQCDEVDRNNHCDARFDVIAAAPPLESSMDRTEQTAA